MGQITMKVTKQLLDKMAYFYEDQLEKNVPTGGRFRARTDKAVITAYQSGKVLFQGANAEEEAALWQGFANEANETNHKQTSPNGAWLPSERVLEGSHIGSDESGTGDYFGPVTAAAVYVKDSDITHLRALGIQDSKQITDDKIEQLAHQLIDLNIPYALMTLPNEKYNVLQRRGWSQGKMKAMIHHSVIASLLEKVGKEPYEGIVIDEFCAPSIFNRHIKEEGKVLFDHTYFMTKAEHASIAVAAGSILARYRYVKEMERLSEIVGFSLQKGASAKVDQQIGAIMKKHGESYLNNIAKVHFANTKKGYEYI